MGLSFSSASAPHSSTPNLSQCSGSSSTEDRILKWPNMKVFSYEELKSATNNFSPDTVIGEGGFGQVFKGWLNEKTLSPARPNSGFGMAVAIKKLNPESTQGFQEWQSAVNFLGNLTHPNLIKLLGYCWDDDELLLVYEFMPKGSLNNHLFRRNRNLRTLDWNTRIMIAIGAARALAFLHASEKQVIFRDFKSSHILLDKNYIAKISDFGLAKLGPAGGQSHVSTRFMGTLGYAAPEYMATGHLYVKSDVYGFGVVLLEMLTGMLALDTDRPTGKHNLVKWREAFLFSKRNLKTIMDANMEGQYSPKAAWRAARLTLKCLEPHPYNRPSMKDVVKELEAIEAIHEKWVFSYAELKSATTNFSHVVGEGGFGIVYRGWLDDKTLFPVRERFRKVVAIKDLRRTLGSMQGNLEWQSELFFLGMLSHPNLVNLLGYCRDGKFLVYEFMPKGSLHYQLFRRNSNLEPLSWNTRLKIAIGAARALAFLHASEKQAMYRDFKASHILLDGNYNAKISDFGLVKLGTFEGQSHVSTRILGTYGYVAPEYMATGHLSVKSDVYGFGVVLLEMLTGMRAIDTNRPTGQQNLVEWTKPLLSSKKKLKTIMDAKREGQYSPKAAMQAAQLTLKCLQPRPIQRPSMQNVLEELVAIEAIHP
ncbi:probable serine/threonine-protein kinase PIX13 [Cajanus cajan]|uniref:probable serine/threonine-protein kinase PIX13 n=1 Tax=Cajanus cajan TaxID=3821 RepID=UPI00098DC532|nr:probable serine/threonine-protein kinase PIX13 [Cajanus cajan]